MEDSKLLKGRCESSFLVSFWVMGARPVTTLGNKA